MNQTSTQQQAMQEAPPGSGHALLIGVDDYSAYGAGADLKGSRQDVLKLYWLCRTVLGLAPENIRVLASPPLTASDFYATAPPPPDMLGAATSAEIQAGVSWLAERMAIESNVAGLLTYSGHGSYEKGRGPLLCPSDIGPDLARGIALRDLSNSAALQKVRSRLTVVLDCCHAAPEPTASDLRMHTGIAGDFTAAEVAADHQDFDVSDRVFLAARPGQSAYQTVLGKVFHGALTFALVTVAEQWKASQSSGSDGMHVSNKQLVERVRWLLWSLRMRQSVRLRVPLATRKATRELPFFGVHAHEKLTVRKPDAERDKVQLTPDWFYTISLSSGTVVAQIVVTGTSTVTVNPGENSYSASTNNYEYWYVNTSALGNLASATSITIGGAPIENNSVALNSAFNPTRPMLHAVNGTWAASLSAPATSTTTTNTIFSGTPAAPTFTGGTVTAYVLFNVTSTTSGGVTTYSLNHVYWYLAWLPTAPTNGALQPAGTPGRSPTSSSVTYNSASLPTSYYALASF